MPFLDEINEVREKVPQGRLPRPVLAGIACIAVAIVVLSALGVASSARGDFIVGYPASSSSAAIESVSESVSRGSGLETAEVEPAGVSGTSETTHAAMCSVYVVGAVKKPGVYELAVGSRVNDAVKEAGGMTKKADISAVNLARVVADGEQITIPEMGEVARCDEPADNAQTMSTRNTSSAITADGKVNINSASSEELQALPGIGEATASKIIASRETEGPFSSTEDLKRVSGIGEKKYAALADLITV